jgi:site-specific recombinase XerD
MATEMLRGGASVIELAKMLGHASPKTTQEYTKLVAADLKKVHAERHPRGR